MQSSSFLIDLSGAEGSSEKNEGLRNRGSTVDNSRNNSVLMQMLQYAK